MLVGIAFLTATAVSSCGKDRPDNYGTGSGGANAGIAGGAGTDAGGVGGQSGTGGGAGDTMDGEGAGGAGGSLTGADGGAIGTGGSTSSATGGAGGAMSFGAGGDMGGGGATAGAGGNDGTGVVPCSGISGAMACGRYCNALRMACTGANSQYPGADQNAQNEACLAACPTWTCGQAGDSTGNTLHCRRTNAIAAGEAIGMPEKLMELCNAAGPNSTVCR